MEFLIPFPFFRRIASGCQRAHYAKPSPGARRAHGRLISRPLRLRAVICRLDFQRRCGRSRFPPSGLVFCGPERGESVRSPLSLRLRAEVPTVADTDTCYIHPPTSSRKPEVLSEDRATPSGRSIRLLTAVPCACFPRQASVLLLLILRRP